jgi:hypothetical protein
MSEQKPVEMKAVSPDDLTKSKKSNVELKEEELQAAGGLTFNFGLVAVKTISWSGGDE